MRPLYRLASCTRSCVCLVHWWVEALSPAAAAAAAARVTSSLSDRCQPVANQWFGSTDWAGVPYLPKSLHSAVPRPRGYCAVQIVGRWSYSDEAVSVYTRGLSVWYGWEISLSSVVSVQHVNCGHPHMVQRCIGSLVQQKQQQHWDVLEAFSNYWLVLSHVTCHRPFMSIISGTNCAF